MTIYIKMYYYTFMSNKLVKIGEAAKLLGSSVANLRNWEKTGDLLPTYKTKGGTRYYNLAALQARIRGPVK